jgi:hypothetical protein
MRTFFYKQDQAGIRQNSYELLTIIICLRSALSIECLGLFRLAFGR